MFLSIFVFWQTYQKILHDVTEGTKTALETCKTIFKNERWNCYVEEKIKHVPVFFGKILPGKTLFTPDMFADDIALLFIQYVSLVSILKTFPVLLELISHMLKHNTSRLM